MILNGDAGATVVDDPARSLFDGDDETTVITIMTIIINMM